MSLKIQTHDNKYLGEIVSLTPVAIGSKALQKNGIFSGIKFGVDYVAYAVELEPTDSPRGYSTLIAKDEESLIARYLVK